MLEWPFPLPRPRPLPLDGAAAAGEGCPGVVAVGCNAAGKVGLVAGIVAEVEAADA